MSMAEDTRKRPEFSDDATNSAPASDPLAELARLIGQNDPFTDLSKRSARKPFDSVRNDDRPAPEWLSRPASAEPEYDEPHAAPEFQEPPQADYRPHAAPGFAGTERYDQHDRYAVHEGAEHADAGYQHDDRYRVSPPSGEYEGDGYYAEDGHMPPQGEEHIVDGRRRGGVLTIAAVLGLAVVGTAGAFGYRAYTSGSGTASSPPIIKADPTPAKTVPAPAPVASADSKPFQDRIGAQASAERVVPREEAPVSLPIAPAAPPPSPRAMAPQPSAQAMAPLVSPPPPTSVNEPKRVKTIPIRNPDSVADTGTIAAPPPSAPPAASTRTPATKQGGATPMTIAPQSEPAAPAPRTKTATRSPNPPASSGSYVVQVSAQRTEAEAQSSYQALQAKFPSVLGGRSASFRRVDLGDKGGVFYRAQVGSFTTSEQATAFCNSLKDAGGQCIVQKN